MEEKNNPIFTQEYLYEFSRNKQETEPFRL